MSELRQRVAVAVGCEVRIRALRKPQVQHLPPGIRADDVEGVVAIVPPGDAGLHRPTPRMPLGGALLGHRAGDAVRVSLQAGTVAFEVLAVEPAPPARRPPHRRGTDLTAAGARRDDGSPLFGIAEHRTLL